MSLPRQERQPPVGPEAPIVPWRLDARWVVIAGVLLWAGAYAASQTTAPAGGFPALFLPAGILVGLLLRIPTTMWAWALVAVGAMSLAAGALLTADGWAANATWAVANTAEALAVAGLLRWWKIDVTRALDPLMVFLAAAVGVAGVAFVASLVLGAIGYGEPTSIWADWWGSDVLSIVLVTPLFLLLGRAALPRGWAAVESVIWLALTAGILAIEFSDQVTGYLPAWMWLVMGTPLVVLYGTRFGLLAMMWFLVAVDLVAVSLTAAGLGPFQELALQPDGTPMRTLQLLLIVLTVILPSICILIHNGLARGRIVAEQQAVLDAVIEGSPVPTVILASTTPEQVIRANRAFRDLGSADSAGGVSLLGIFPETERFSVIRLIESAPPDRQEVSAEFAGMTVDGEPRLLRVRVAAVSADGFDRSGAVRPKASVTRVVHVEDITEARNREHRLHRDATTDPLTGLANRRQMLHILHASLSRVSPARLLAVTYLDLNGFKEINDRFGHTVGDRLLQQVADCLRECVRPADLVARVGGDEFVVVSPELPDRMAAESQAERIRRHLETRTGSPMVASLGVAVTDDPGISGDELLRQADREMYRAKYSREVTDIRTPHHR